MLDDLGESFARHVYAAVNAIAGRLPGGDATVQDRYVLIAQAVHPLCGAHRRAVAIVAPHHARGPPRHQGVDQQFETAQRHAGRHQQMTPAKDSFLARIQQRDLAAVMHLSLQFARIDVLDLLAHRRLLAIPAASFLRQPKASTPSTSPILGLALSPRGHGFSRWRCAARLARHQIELET